MAADNEIREKLDEIRRKLMVMEWDKNHNQLNPGKLGLYNELLEQKTRLESELSSIPIVDETEANSEIKKID